MNRLGFSYLSLTFSYNISEIIIKALLWFLLVHIVKKKAVWWWWWWW